jgi:hypothetical protein
MVKKIGRDKKMTRLNLETRQKIGQLQSILTELKDLKHILNENLNHYKIKNIEYDRVSDFLNKNIEIIDIEINFFSNCSYKYSKKIDDRITMFNQVKNGLLENYNYMFYMEPKGQIITEDDPFGEENWDSEEDNDVEII